MIPVYAVDDYDRHWKKLLGESYRDPGQLLADLALNEDALPYRIDSNNPFPFKVTRSFAQRMEKGKPFDPLLLQVLPLAEENQIAVGFSADPLEEQQTSEPGIIRKYKGRALLVLTPSCAINCRYCFRRHFPYEENRLTSHALEHIGNYFNQHTELEEVILSGGEPLLLDDDRLERLIAKLEACNHLQRLRIHTRLPVVLPERLTRRLQSILANSRLQTVMVLHINHPQEIDEFWLNQIESFRHPSITLLNQAVLLKGINDSVSVQAKLSKQLFRAGILPYYLHLMDKVQGAAHFVVDEANALKIHKQLQGELSGFMVPKLVREIAGEDSKTIING